MSPRFMQFWRMSEARAINPLLRGQYIYEAEDGSRRVLYWNTLQPALPLTRGQVMHSLPPHVVAQLNRLATATAADLARDELADGIEHLFTTGLALAQSVETLANMCGRNDAENFLEKLIATTSITRIERMMPEKAKRSDFYDKVAFDLTSEAMDLAKQARALVEGDRA